MTAPTAALLAEADELQDEEVWDGWAEWSVRIEKRTRRGREQYRYVMERHFVRTFDERKGLWRRDLAKVLRHARAQLKSHERHRYERVSS